MLLVFLAGWVFPTCSSSAEDYYDVSGTVTKSDGGEANGAMVNLRKNNDTPGITVSTGDDGRYVLRGFKQGTYTITASLEGYSYFTDTVGVSGDITYDITLQKSTSYTVTFDKNGGNELDPALAVQTVEYGTLFGALTPPGAARAGYAFAGWYTMAAGGEEYTATTPVTADITLYARWNSASSEEWLVTTLAGSGAAGSTNGTGASAQFNRPTGIAVDSGGNVYVTEVYGHRIREISPDGTVITIAGSGVAGYGDGPGASAKFFAPGGVAVDGMGYVYVTDTVNDRIREISPAGVVTTIAGSGVAGYADDTGTSAQFDYPYGVAVDGASNIYVTDYNNHRIRKISSGSVVTTIAGSGAAGYANGTGISAQFNRLGGAAVDGTGNIYVADRGNHCIRKISSGNVVTTIAGSGAAGYANGIGTSARFRNPIGVAVDSADNIYVADLDNHCIRKISSGGVVTTIAGNGTAGYANGIGASAQFNEPTDVAVDGEGNIYVADSNNHRIRKLTRQ
jgi:uncharacterized repeat protein (TIGR02543 family)